MRVFLFGQYMAGIMSPKEMQEMSTWLWPLLLVVVSNVLYNIASKSVPPQCSPYITLVATYSTATILSLICYFVFDWQKNVLSSLHTLNWTAFALGISMVGLEAGYIFMYRLGAKISIASLLSNILLAVILFLVGWLFFKERLNAVQIAGIIICIVGSIMLIIGGDR